MQDQIYEIMCEIRASELRIPSATQVDIFPFPPEASFTTL